MYRHVKEFWKYFVITDAIKLVGETCTATTSLCMNRVWKKIFLI